jgi:light-regulated signal transduction histidine kinase (bacteriophytochrome)
VVGVVCLGHCDRADAFDDDMVELLDLLSAQLAVSLENVGLFDDLWNEVTERKRVEDSLRQLNEHLERRVEERTRELEVAVAALARSNSELEQFAYAASHDLQEPLRVISGFSGLLKTQCGERLDDTGRMYISHMSEAADRMRRLVADLLGYSRLTSRIAPPSPVEPSEVLAEVRVNLQAAFEESGASLTHDELPVVMADRAQFLRLLQNLVGNAVKYRGEDQPWVHVSGRQQGDEWIFGVADNGIGIPKAQQSSVFDIFRRLHRTDEYPGTGIGLASVKKIVECQGGRVWVESQEGAGSTFWFTWPVQSPDQPVLTGRDPRSSAPTLDLPANG